MKTYIAIIDDNGTQRVFNIELDENLPLNVKADAAEAHYIEQVGVFDEDKMSCETLVEADEFPHLLKNVNSLF